MPTFFKLDTPAAFKARLWLALLLVYVVWGTTYFGLSVALKSMPPLFMNTSRFLAAGLLMLALARWQGAALPTARQWRNSALVGGLMVLLAMNLVGFAQKLGIGSGLMATVVATMPMWLTLWTRVGGEPVRTSSWVALGLGVAGALLLALEGDFSATWLGAMLAFGAPLCWSLGSYASRKLDLPGGAMAPAAQWLTGGLLGVLPTLVFEGSTPWMGTSASAWVAWVYLLAMGTLVALNAYLWLLKHASPTLAGSYSFVNPAVALLVGVWLGNESLTGWVFAALPLIGLALALLLYGPHIGGAWARFYDAARGLRGAKCPTGVPKNT
jgi:drug/metabolite transporter (DMT)-like permease